MFYLSFPLDPQLSRELSGKTFSKVLGTKSSCLELFLLNTSLMGPSWISINQANPVSTKVF